MSSFFWCIMYYKDAPVSGSDFGNTNQVFVLLLLFVTVLIIVAKSCWTNSGSAFTGPVAGTHVFGMKSGRRKETVNATSSSFWFLCVIYPLRSVFGSILPTLILLESVPAPVSRRLLNSWSGVSTTGASIIQDACIYTLYEVESVFPCISLAVYVTVYCPSATVLTSCLYIPSLSSVGAKE